MTKFIKNIFQPYLRVKELEEQNEALREKIHELAEANEGLWDMIEDIRASDFAAVDYINFMQPYGEA